MSFQYQFLNNFSFKRLHRPNERSPQMTDKYTVQKRQIYLRIAKHTFIFEKLLIWMSYPRAIILHTRFLQSSKWLHHPTLFCKPEVNWQSWSKTNSNQNNDSDDTLPLRFIFYRQLCNTFGIRIFLCLDKVNVTGKKHHILATILPELYIGDKKLRLLKLHF